MKRRLQIAKGEKESAQQLATALEKEVVSRKHELERLEMELRAAQHKLVIKEKKCAKLEFKKRFQLKK